MTPTDELRQLWQSDINEAINQRELLLQVKQKQRAFNRRIRGRDLRESIGGLLVTLLFGGFALRGGTATNLVADIWLAGCGLWIVFYLRRYSGLSRTPAPDQSLASYRAELLASYDRQIRLLKTVKYWYILPIWLGLMIHSSALLIDGGHWLPFLGMATLMTVVNAVVWWMNEGPGVRNLVRRRLELTILLGEEGVSK